MATRVPLTVYAPGVTSPPPPWPGKKTFPFVNVFENPQERYGEGYPVRSVVELVDVFPTVASLAGLAPLRRCPFPSFEVVLCTEGSNLARLLGRRERAANHEAYAFTQYPRPGDAVRGDSDLPSLANISVMGYTARTADFRLTLWVGFDPSRFYANMSDVHAGEIYVLSQDPGEDDNLYDGRAAASTTGARQPWTESLRARVEFFKETLEKNGSKC